MFKADQNNCHDCEYKRNIPGNCHIACSNPDPEMIGIRHGVKNGWFFYPGLFDPVWKARECRNFLDKNSGEKTKK